jgi:hypothetical protein
MSPTPWKICPRCGVSIANESTAYFSHSPTPQTFDTLSSKVCQWAYAKDLREGKVSPSSRPQGCINPTYDPLTPYPNPLDDLPEIPSPRPDEL